MRPTPSVQSLTDSLALHKAAWVVPIAGPPIECGAVLTRGGLILEVARQRDLQKHKIGRAKIVDHGSSALLPCLVNAHTHLELSCLEGKISFPQAGFADWLRQVFAHRNSASTDDEACGFLKGQQELLSSGTGLYGDISNGAFLSPEEQAAFPVRHAFLEALGFNRHDLRSALGEDAPTALGAQDHLISLAAHACYSTSASLIQQAKAWCRDRGLPFSIHVAEHAEEIEFLQNGSGYCRDLLQSLGKWVPDWAPPRMTPVEYLDSLGVLDGRTILVHAVHLEDSDWRIVKQRGSSVCFCPRSNRNLNAGRPAIEKAAEMNIQVCLGTDSLASNEDLNLFSEAHHILDRYPEISPDTVLFMSTLAGARALQRDDQFGSLQSGKRSVFLSVFFGRTPSLSRLSEAILSCGNQGAWKWVNCPQNN